MPSLLPPTQLLLERPAIQGTQANGAKADGELLKEISRGQIKRG